MDVEEMKPLVERNALGVEGPSPQGRLLRLVMGAAAVAGVAGALIVEVASIDRVLEHHGETNAGLATGSGTGKDWAAAAPTELQLTGGVGSTVSSTDAILYKLAYPTANATSAGEFLWNYMGDQISAPYSICGKLTRCSVNLPTVHATEADFEIHFVEATSFDVGEAGTVSSWETFWSSANADFSSYNRFMDNSVQLWAPSIAQVVAKLNQDQITFMERTSRAAGGTWRHVLTQIADTGRIVEYIGWNDGETDAALWADDECVPCHEVIASREELSVAWTEAAQGNNTRSNGLPYLMIIRVLTWSNNPMLSARLYLAESVALGTTLQLHTTEAVGHSEVEIANIEFSQAPYIILSFVRDTASALPSAIASELAPNGLTTPAAYEAAIKAANTDKLGSGLSGSHKYWTHWLDQHLGFHAKYFESDISQEMRYEHFKDSLTRAGLGYALRSHKDTDGAQHIYAAMESSLAFEYNAPILDDWGPDLCLCDPNNNMELWHNLTGLAKSC